MSYIKTPVITDEGTVKTGDGDTPREAIENTLAEIEEMTPEESTASENMETDKGLCEVFLGDDEAVEIRFWGEKAELGGDGPNVKVTFEISVDESCPMHEELGVYSADNIRNGGEFYEAIDDDLKELIRDAYGESATRDLHFIKEKGSSVFTGAARFR